ncbi:hypothetical protein [Virgibacillus halodenitrificans]|uniref:hypothetical protein n=1 Tax=Virgibacillus halodenitrificans TaxID=1482 RepID=UPI000EF4492F|nr:hypothetical protein [Virgibacillus halodenitrificans]
MREKLVAALQQTKEDAVYMVYHFSPKGTFRTKVYQKSFVEDLINDNKEIRIHPNFKNVIMIGETGVSLNSFEHNIYFETPNTEGYLEYVSKYNPYYKIYIRLNKKSKTIEFKLGDKYKKLGLIEEGSNGYVSKPYRQKYMKCDSAEELEKHIHDDWWKPRMVDIGRRVLKIKSILADNNKKKIA